MKNRKTLLTGTCLVLLLFVPATFLPGLVAQDQRQSKSPFESNLAKYEGMTSEQLLSSLPKRNFVDSLSFDPAKAEYYNLVVEGLQLNVEEKKKLRSNGFVFVDHDQRYSFPAMYYTIYTRDLPVFITSDSILHAVHRSFEDVLADIEVSCIVPKLKALLTQCHVRLGEMAEENPEGVKFGNLRDVDLYLTVARNLIETAEKRSRRPKQSASQPTIRVSSNFDQDEKVVEILQLIGSLKSQYPNQTDPTAIYGGQRYVDYSQFQPRGHYERDYRLRPYFRCMMWLGRSDCGWHVEAPSNTIQAVIDSDRELLDAIVLTQLLESTGQIKAFNEITELIDTLVGPSDSLSPLTLVKPLASDGILSLDQAVTANQLTSLRQALPEVGLGKQQIRSQLVLSNVNSSEHAPPPSMFQLFGQRFTLDAFVLSNVVFDSIVFEGKKVRRMMPRGLDVMSALGNDLAIKLLEYELEEFRYAANLSALRDDVDGRPKEFWRRGLYNRWLDCLRTLDRDMNLDENAPEVMKTKMWQRKQLQTQLASWAELRHDMLLYGKQSYTGGPSCEYPTGFVEPYPELYSRLKGFYREASRLVGQLEFAPQRSFPARPSTAKSIKSFFDRSAKVFDQLETLSRKELALEPFTETERLWLKKTIDKFWAMSGPPRYNGWYCDLYYRHEWEIKKWCPTVSDVHTNPESGQVLQAAVGDANFCVVAIDSGDDRAVYVGPGYSYYEFVSPTDVRLQDQKWQQRISSGDLPERPEWTLPIVGPREKRGMDKRTKFFVEY